MSFTLLLLGSLGSMVVWLFFVRPYVVAHGKGHMTGASMGVAIWVDWQSCGEIAKAENDEKGGKIYRAFAVFQLMAVIGFLLIFTGI